MKPEFLPWTLGGCRWHEQAGTLSKGVGPPRGTRRLALQERVVVSPFCQGREGAPRRGRFRSLATQPNTGRSLCFNPVLPLSNLQDELFCIIKAFKGLVYPFKK